MIRKKAAHGEDGVIKFTNLMLKSKLKTVLDIGCGEEQIHITYMKKKNLDASGIDVLEGPTFLGDYNDYIFGKKFDGILASHVLEHQLNTHNFLKKIYYDLEEGGWLCITVPPLKHNIVGGHVSLWNAGLILYHLVLAGFDCTETKVKVYGYNISVIIKKKPIKETFNLTYDSKDINIIHPYLPQQLNYGKLKNKIFDGNIQVLNW